MTFVGSRVLITGGLGFIGSNVARRLALAGADVTVIDNLMPTHGGNRFNINGLESKIRVDIGDVRDTSRMRRLLVGKDYLFNLAGQTGHLASMRDPELDLAINATAQLGILEACREVNPAIRIVFTSTRQVYGRPEYLPVNETHTVRPVDVNGINKLAGEMYHCLYASVYGLHACVLRLTNTYGQGMRVKDACQMFLGVWVRQVLEGKPIQVFGDGLQQRDFNHVDDCVDALVLAAQSRTAAGKVYNLGGAEVISLAELAKLMVGLGFGGAFECVPFPDDRKAIDIGDYYGDFKAIRSELGWSPKVSLAVGLQRTLEYYKEYAEHYWP